MQMNEERNQELGCGHCVYESFIGKCTEKTKRQKDLAVVKPKMRLHSKPDLPLLQGTRSTPPIGLCGKFEHWPITTNSPQAQGSDSGVMGVRPERPGPSL